MDRPGVWRVPEGSGERGKMEKTGRKIICGSSTNVAVKGLVDNDDDDDVTGICFHEYAQTSTSLNQTCNVCRGG